MSKAFEMAWNLLKEDDVDTLSLDEAREICAAGGCVYLKDHAGTSSRFYNSPDYPVEDPDDLSYFADEDPTLVILRNPRPLN